jgi:hypothetical protein
MLKPIETVYRGYRFRSRLEARWAVFLEHARAVWQYEVEGFALPSGSYLPDFHCPDLSYGTIAPPLRTFIEVKPAPHPWGWSWEPKPISRPLPREVQLGYELATLLTVHFVIVYGDPLDVLDIADDGGSVAIDPSGKIEQQGIGPLDYIPPLRAAANAARAARFEHGEHP